MGMPIPKGIESSSLAPIKFFFSAIFFFLLLNILIIINTNKGIFEFSYLRNFQVLTMVHLATLGWAVMIIIGAIHQLVPVVLEVPLYSAKLAEVTFYSYLVGVTGFLLSLYLVNIGLPIILFSSLIFFALFLKLPKLVL